MTLIANLVPARGKGTRKLYAATAYVAGGSGSFDTGLSAVEWAVAGAYGADAAGSKWASVQAVDGGTVTAAVFHAEAADSVVVQASGASVEVTVMAIGH